MRDHLGVYQVSSDLQFAKGVLLLEDCEGTMNWGSYGTGADYTVEFATAAAFMGTNGLHIATRTTTPAEDDLVYATKWIGFTESGLLVCRWRWSSPDISDVKRMYFAVFVRDGSYEYQGELQYYPGTPNAAYRNEAGGITSIPSMAKSIADDAWTQCELVIDIDALEYVSASMFGETVDLAGQALNMVGADTDSGLQILVGCYAAGAAVAEVHADAIYCGEFLAV